MRLRINRSLKTKTKKKTEHGVLRCLATKKTNKTKHVSNVTEPIILIAFTTSLIMAFFISFNMLHVAALLILFKYLTNFPMERDIEEPRETTIADHRKLLRQLRGWRRRKRRAKGQLTRCTVKLILVTMVTVHLAGSIAQLNNPENPKHVFSRLLYSLSHDTLIANNTGSDIPVRRDTMTRNRSRIRRDLKDLFKSLNSITQDGMKLLNNILNARNDNIRNIAKMIAKVWIFLLRKMWTFVTRTNTDSRKQTETWSPKNCGECDICVPKGPHPRCPLCNAELIGPMNYLRINTEIIVTLPIDIMKSMAWTTIKHPMIITIDMILAHLIYQGPEILTGLLIRTRKGLIEILSDESSENHITSKNNPQDKEPKNSGQGRQKRKRNSNLRWHHRQKVRESLKTNKQGLKTKKPSTQNKGTKDTIAQYDGNDDPISDIDEDDSPLEQVLTSTYGWHKTKSPNYPKGLKFWSDPNKPPEEIIWENPPPSTPPKINRDFVWKNERDEEVEEEKLIPDNELERTGIMTINVRSCYSGAKRTEVRDGILDANPDVAIVTETWLLEGDQDLMIPGYNPIVRCDRRNTNGKKLPASERGGGVLVIAKDYITLTGAESHQVDKYIQVVSFVLDKVTIFGVYRSPKTLKENHQKLTKFLEQQLNKLGNQPFVITGDMNLGDLADQDFDPDLIPVGAETENGIQVKTFEHMWTMLIKKHQIVQHVEEPTCQTGKILDYVFAPDYLDVAKLKVDRHSFLPGTTDHYAVIFELDCFFQRSREEVFKRKESKNTWREFHRIMPSQQEIMKDMPSENDGLRGQDLIDKMST